MTLYVDRREETKHYDAPPLAPYLERHITPRSLVEVIELSSGDAAHSIILPGGRLGMAGYEIKHVGDVLDCMEDGRLTGVGGQLEHMVDDYDVRWIVLEDRIEPDEHTGVLMKKLPSIRLARKKGTRARRNPLRLQHNSKTSDNGRWVPALYSNARQTRYETLVKFLTIACFGYGAMLWRTSSRDETAQFLATEYRMWQEKWESHTSLRRFNDAVASNRPMIGLSKERRKRAKLVNAFDDIGFEKGCAIARRYGTMREMLEALLRGDVDEFAQVVCNSGSGRVQKVGRAAAVKLIEQVNSAK